MRRKNTDMRVPSTSRLKKRYEAIARNQVVDVITERHGRSIFTVPCPRANIWMLNDGAQFFGIGRASHAAVPSDLRHDEPFQ